ncbi:uncharacterized protein LOC127005884 [Eriocheir sinensis]|uniref:uncharacterized protein LOC127005884 n=1 Tax=Eriocheir sinensis TaxID=95602 RepID=UPI0021C8807F|nr:uncharacterized protein LOC127005884 [Eriocheir sinensis]XP_050731173.1 uncharacterized protein LOC127005884 [Eriocheir sinensis]
MKSSAALANAARNACVVAGLAFCCLLWVDMRITFMVLRLRWKWEAVGPHTSLLGKMRGRLAETSWLGALRPAPPRDPLAECGLLPLGSPGAGGLREALRLAVHAKGSLDCLQRQIGLALDEHEELAGRLQVVASWGLVLILLVLLAACSFLMRKSRTRHCLSEEDVILPASGESVALQEEPPVRTRSPETQQPGEVAL